MAQPLPFNGFYTGNSEKNSARTCVNYMPIRHDSGALSEYTLESTAGITGPVTHSLVANPGPVVSEVITWGNKSAGLTNAKVLFVSSQRVLFASRGENVESYQMGGGFNSYDIRFAKGSDLLLINTRSTNTTQSGWIYDGTASIPTLVDYSTQLGLGGNENIADVAYFGDRYLLMSEAETSATPHKGRVYYSGIGDPSTYGALDFFRTLEQNSKNTGIHVLNARLYLFSDDGYTVWTVSPDVNLPFQQQKGSSGSIGMLDPMGKCEVGGVLYFIGRDGQQLGLYALSGGGAPKKISTEYIDSFLNKNSSKSFVRCFPFTDADRNFISINMNDTTLCLDILTGEYHRRGSGSARWEVVGAGYNEGDNNRQVLIGKDIDFVSGTSYNVKSGFSDSAIGTEFGNQVEREMVTSPFNSDGVTNNVRELAFQTDIDYSSLAPATLPDLSLSVSENFGKTFEAERLEAFDADGENTKILRYMNIGFFRQAFVFKLKTNSIYPHKILKMLTRLEKGFRQI